MATGTARRFNMVTMTARHLGSMPSTRLAKLTLGWSITVCGTCLLINEVSATIGAFLHAVAAAWR